MSLQLAKFNEKTAESTLSINGQDIAVADLIDVNETKTGAMSARPIPQKALKEAYGLKNAQAKRLHRQLREKFKTAQAVEFARLSSQSSVVGCVVRQNAKGNRWGFDLEFKAEGSAPSDTKTEALQRENLELQAKLAQMEEQLKALAEASAK